MRNETRSLLREVGQGLQQVNKANAEHADLIRRLEYPAVLDRVRSPPVTLPAVLAGLLDALLTLAVRLPLHALRGIAALLPEPPLKHDPSDLGRDLRSLLAAVVCTGDYAAHWLSILGRVAWIELKILGMAAATGAFLGIAYAVVIFGGLWLLLFVLAG